MGEIMNSNRLLNRAEIMLYSSLISVMSGMNGLKAKVQHLTNLTTRQPLDGAMVNGSALRLSAGKTLEQAWKSLEQVLVAMLLWAILGFAAGFLIGMLQGG
jgi:ABC-type nitrate/sulfonate/bicarbonate transport system permease component